jgi:hypothetical protein
MGKLDQKLRKDVRPLQQKLRRKVLTPTQVGGKTDPTFPTIYDVSLSGEYPSVPPWSVDDSETVTFDADSPDGIHNSMDITVTTNYFDVSLELPATVNCSTFPTVSFWFKGQDTGSTITFVLYSNAANAAYTFIDSSTSWSAIHIPESSFTITGSINWAAIGEIEMWIPSGAASAGQIFKLSYVRNNIGAYG